MSLMPWMLALAANAQVPELEVESIELDNGLQVFLVEDHRVPLVAVNLWYHVGGGNEVPGRSGFAHLFEHIMFQGSKNVEEDTFFRYLEGVGAAVVNGTTNFDRTNYFETVPSHQLALALWLESDRMGFLLDTLSQERLDNQIAVVRKERQQRTENAPYGIADERFFKLMFPAPHPYHGVVIGSHEDLSSSTLDDVRDFFTTWYAPNNASLAIVGDIDIEETKRLVDTYFGTLPAGGEPPPLVVSTQPIETPRRADLTDNVELPRVTMGWLTPPIFTEGDAELEFAGDLLAGGKSSDLYRELVDGQQIAQSVAAGQYSLTQGSVFYVEVMGRPNTSVGTLEREVLAQLDRFASAAPDAERLAAAKVTWRADFLRGFERLGGFGGVADVLNTYQHHLGTPNGMSDDFARHENVTPEAIRAVFRRTIRENNRVTVTVVPHGGEG